MTDNNTIENNFEQLENILKDMQSEKVTLEESFELYKKGIDLVKECSGQIDEIEKKIIVLEEGSVDEL